MSVHTKYSASCDACEKSFKPVREPGHDGWYNRKEELDRDLSNYHWRFVDRTVCLECRVDEQCPYSPLAAEERCTWEWKEYNGQGYWDRTPEQVETQPC